MVCVVIVFSQLSVYYFRAMRPLVGYSDRTTGLPVLLTVEEAGALLRIGRTKAYAMAREWRETDGRSGLPVIDLGHALRVPRHALEEMVGSDLSTATLEGRVDGDAAGGKDQPSASSVNPASTGQTNSGRHNRIRNQLDLFDSDNRAD